jgi:methionyl aminopeptidase
MRQGGRILVAVLEHVADQVRPGVTTAELAQAARAEVARRGAEPAFWHYQGFPDVICISVNDEVVHGLPGARSLQAGDIVGLDFGVRYDGLVTDGAITVPVGEVSPEAERLLAATAAALAAGITAARAGARIGNISAAIEARLAAGRLGIVEELSGHGVGREIHEDPPVYNRGRAGTGPLLVAGQTLAIEPMATLGSGRVKLARDGWTWRSADGTLAAQFEHTVVVTADGAEILTQLDEV